jgi:hypothetical protein
MVGGRRRGSDAPSRTRGLGSARKVTRTETFAVGTVTGNLVHRQQTMELCPNWTLRPGRWPAHGDWQTSLIPSRNLNAAVQLRQALRPRMPYYKTYQDEELSESENDEHQEKN